MDKAGIRLDKTDKTTAAVQRFYLYGEAPADVAPDFLHVETIHARAAPLQGDIKPHVHTGLSHVFVIEEGEGEIRADDRAWAFAGAHLLFIPAGTVHGFRFSPAVGGYVITLASTFLAAVRAPALPAAGLSLPLDTAWRTELCFWAERLMAELAWETAQQRAAAAVYVEALLIAIARLRESQARLESPPPAPQRLLAAFRAAVEARFREELPIKAYLEGLRVTEAQLRYACAQGGETSPGQVIQARRLLEAKRLLIYSDLPVSACALSAGFADPAYFSRLFARAAAMPPTVYRIRHRG